MGHAPREEGSGAIHHVVAKASGGESIVRYDVDRSALIQRLGEATNRHGWMCLAYCLLDTHVHVVVATPKPNLGTGMQWFLSRYAREFNKRHERDGNLFHTRFYSKRITSDAQLTSTLIYVYLNPVTAGIVGRAEVFSWSSYASTIGTTAAPDFLAIDAVLELIDERPESAQLQLQLAVNETLRRDRTGGVSDTVSDTRALDDGPV